MRFVLQRNVQRSGSRIRINTQLSDTRGDAQPWGESFDGNSAELRRAHEVLLRAQSLDPRPQTHQLP